jgi:hypothetical protein
MGVPGKTTDGGKAMIEVCVKRTAQGETVVGLAEGFVAAADERIIGRGKAVKSGKSAYFCKDRKAILSPGDVVYVNGDDGGGWVEIVEFVRQEAGEKETVADDSRGAGLYNEGVDLYGKNRMRRPWMRSNAVITPDAIGCSQRMRPLCASRSLDPPSRSRTNSRTRRGRWARRSSPAIWSAS